MSFKGIDISNCNGSVNLNLAKQSGISAVYIKATEGVDFKDSRYVENANKAIQAGLPFGFYHYMSEKTNPLKQAVDFFNAIKGFKYNLIPVLDIEINNYRRSSTQVSDRVMQFLNKFKELSGLDCIIYTGAYFGRDTLDSRVKKYKGWIAHYGVNKPMETGFNVVGHQYSETGRIPGIAGNCDVNNFENGILLSNINIKNTSTSPTITSTNGNVEIAERFLGTKHNVLKVQYILNCFNYNLTTDGICGNKTASAIGEFQRKNGLAVDYMFGSKSLNAAYNGMKNVLCGIKFHTPLYTRLIQFLLNINVDGIFGQKTEGAVREFQQKRNLSPDGIVGAATWKRLLGL